MMESTRHSVVGGMLREARERQHVKIHDAAEALKIREAYLAALESGTYETIPGNTFVTGYLRNYAQFLGLDRDEVYRIFLAEEKGLREEKPGFIPEPTVEAYRPSRLMLALSVLLCAGIYGAWRMFAAEEGPIPLTVEPVPPALLQATTTPSLETVLPQEEIIDERAAEEIAVDSAGEKK